MIVKSAACLFQLVNYSPFTSSYLMLTGEKQSQVDIGSSWFTFPFTPLCPAVFPTVRLMFGVLPAPFSFLIFHFCLLVQY